MAEINLSIKKKVGSFLVKLVENGIKPEKVYIFGSYAKGVENSLSDIDSKIEPVSFNSNTFVEEDPLVWEILKTGILIHQEKIMSNSGYYRDQSLNSLL